MQIVIIDDSPEDREWLAILARQKHEVTVHGFATGAEGIEYCKHAHVDCILLDNNLNGEDGLGVLAVLKADSVLTPVILMTGNGNEELAKYAIKAGASRYISKHGLTAAKLSQTISGAVEEAEEDRKSAGVDATRLKILLVEDNNDDRAQIRDMILSANNGISVHDVATGPAAVAYFDANDVDCVILDYRLEIEDGLDILAILKERSPFTPVIMLTGQGNEEVAAKSIKVGAADYLVKQRLNEIYLRTAIDNAISRSALEAKIADQEAQRHQFLSILVHDLRAPLRNVSSLGQVAQETFDEGDLDSARGFLNDQSVVAKRANELISTLETYALLDGEVQISKISLSEAAHAAKDNLATEILERKAVVEIGELPDVQGNLSQLTQLLQNLIGNGLKYNESLEPSIRIESESSSTASIVVRDNGIGIPAKFQKTIFAPLKRLWGSHVYEGTGLGLAICQKVVERHGGSIWCTSIEGEGSQFHIKFPQ